MRAEPKAHKRRVPVLLAGLMLCAVTTAHAAETPEITLPDVLAVELPKGVSQIGPGGYLRITYFVRPGEHMSDLKRPVTITWTREGKALTFVVR